MQEIGVWVTEAGPISANLEFGAEGSEDGEFTLPAWASGALQGAATGALTGAAAGPYGALIGGVAGATIGGVSAAATPPPKPTPRPAPQTAPRAAPTGQAPPPATAGQSAALTQALQQLAMILPALIQVAASSGRPAGAGRTEAAGIAADGDAVWATESAESVDAAEWALSAAERSWTVP